MEDTTSTAIAITAASITAFTFLVIIVFCIAWKCWRRNQKRKSNNETMTRKSTGLVSVPLKNGKPFARADALIPQRFPVYTVPVDLQMGRRKPSSRNEKTNPWSISRVAGTFSRVFEWRTINSTRRTEPKQRKRPNWLNKAVGESSQTIVFGEEEYDPSYVDALDQLKRENSYMDRQRKPHEGSLRHLPKIHGKIPARNKRVIVL